MIFVLGALLVASWAAQLLRERMLADERRRLLSAALAKNYDEFVALERVSQPTPRRRRRNADEDETPLGPLVGAA